MRRRGAARIMKRECCPRPRRSTLKERAVYRTIMVPLNGSALAERALPFGESLTTCAGSQLVLVRAAMARRFPHADDPDTQQRVMEEAKRYLATAPELIDADAAHAPDARLRRVQAHIEELRRRRDGPARARNGRRGRAPSSGSDLPRAGGRRVDQRVPLSERDKPAFCPAAYATGDGAAMACWCRYACTSWPSVVTRTSDASRVAIGASSSAAAEGA